MAKQRRTPPASTATDAAASSGAPSPARAGRDVLILLFVVLAALGLFARRDVFRGRHLENDEQVYRALVVQLDRGAGYTLQGIAIPADVLPPEMYAQKLFYHHPPGGVAYFWLMWRLAGPSGFALAQTLAFLAFLWGAMRLHRIAVPDASLTERALVATLAAFTPIAAHVATNHWLDGPLLAVVTIAAGVTLEALRDRDAKRALLAGALLGLASWIKLPGLLAVPGVLALAWALEAKRPNAAWWKTAALVLGVTLVVQAPWELWQWSALGTPFPPNMGKPSADLLANNGYERMVTVDRPWWVYAKLLPTVLWSFVPAALALWFVRSGPASRRAALALFAWIVAIVLPHTILGAMGWPKLLRLVVLVTPATLLLAAFALRHAARNARGERGLEIGAISAFAVVVLGIALEVVQGVVTTLVDRHDVIVSLWR